MQYATLTDKAAKDFAITPGLAESWDRVQRRQDVHVHAAAEPQVVRRPAAHGRGRRLDDQPLARGGVAQPLLDDRQPDGEGARARHGRDHQLGAGPEAARSWTSTSSRSTSGRSSTRSRSRSTTARTASARGPFTLDEFKKGQFARFKANPNYYGGKPAARRGRLPAVQQRGRDGRRPESGEIDFGGGPPGQRVRPARGASRGSRPSRATRAASTSSPSTAATASRSRIRRCWTRRCARRSRTRSTSRRSSTASTTGTATLGRHDEPVREPGVDARDARRREVRLRPRQGQADPRRRGLQGHGRRRHPRDARRRRAAEVPLRGPLRVPELRPDRRVHHGLAEGDRHRHDPEDLRRRPAHRGHRQGRLRHVRLGLDAVRGPGPDALLHRPATRSPGPEEPDRTTTTTRTSATRSTTSSTRSRTPSSTRTSGWTSCTRC